MADSILQMYGNTIGVGITNAVAIVDVPQSARLRKIRFMPVFRGLQNVGGNTDFSCIFEVSTLPTARFFNNGDYGNVMGRASWLIENMFTTTGGGSASLFSQESTGLDIRVTVGLRIFLHVYSSIIPTVQDDCMVDLFMDT